MCIQLIRNLAKTQAQHLKSSLIKLAGESKQNTRNFPQAARVRVTERECVCVCVGVKVCARFWCTASGKSLCHVMSLCRTTDQVLKR